MSSDPKRAAVCSIAPLTAASSRTSTASGRAWPPARSIAAAAEWIVPSSLGCGVSVLAAIAILAPSRAARSAIASPMPREAPVMKRVLPLSDIKSPLACKECFEGHLRLRRIQAFAEDFGFLIDACQQVIGRSAHQSARKCNRAGGQSSDLTRRLQAFGIDVFRRDYDAKIGRAHV